MLKRESTLRCLLNQISSPNRHRHRSKAPIMAYVTGSDSFTKGFHDFPQKAAYFSPSLHLFRSSSVSIDNGGCSSSSVCFRINRGRSDRFTVRNCSDSHKQVLVSPHNQLLKNLEAGLEDSSHRNGNLSATYVNGNGSCQSGKPLGFPDYNLTAKAVVAVDVDEVLGNFVSALNRFIADRYSSIHSVSEYHVYEFFKIWNCTRDEADLRVHEFFKTSYFKSGIYPLPGAQNVLQNLSTLCKFSVVTSRQNVIKDHTIDWIEKHYPGVFHEIHFGNHFALDGESKPKSEICRLLGATVLIDDNPRYAIECAEVGIKVLLFDYENSYPWCKSDSVDQHPLVTRVHNWEQVEQQLISWIS